MGEVHVGFWAWAILGSPFASLAVIAAAGEAAGVESASVWWFVILVLLAAFLGTLAVGAATRRARHEAFSGAFCSALVAAMPLWLLIALADAEGVI